MTSTMYLRCVTFNIWDTPVVAAHKLPRMKKIAELFSRNERQLDVIGVQEIFFEDTRDLLIEAAHKGGLKYHAHFASGADLPSRAGGAGVMIFSRYPIVEMSFKRFSVNGKPTHLHHWDWHTGKGVGLARISTPCGMVDAYVSHFIAQYEDTPDDEYEFHRLSQAFEAAQFIRLTRRSPLALFLADMNTGPDSEAFSTFVALTGMKDAYISEHHKEGNTITRSRRRHHLLPTRSGYNLRQTLGTSKENNLFTENPVEKPTVSSKPVSTEPISRIRSISDATFGLESNSFFKGSYPSWITKPQSCDINARLDYVMFHIGNSESSISDVQVQNMRLSSSPSFAQNLPRLSTNECSNDNKETKRFNDTHGKPNHTAHDVKKTMRFNDTHGKSTMHPNHTAHGYTVELHSVHRTLSQSSYTSPKEECMDDISLQESNLYRKESNVQSNSSHDSNMDKTVTQSNEYNLNVEIPSMQQSINSLQVSPLHISSSTQQYKRSEWCMVDSEICFDETFQLDNGQYINLSDHFAVYASFRCQIYSPMNHMRHSAYFSSTHIPFVYTSDHNEDKNISHYNNISDTSPSATVSDVPREISATDSQNSRSTLSTEVETMDDIHRTQNSLRRRFQSNNNSNILNQNMDDTLQISPTSSSYFLYPTQLTSEFIPLLRSCHMKLQYAMNEVTKRRIRQIKLGFACFVSALVFVAILLSAPPAPSYSNFINGLLRESVGKNWYLRYLFPYINEISTNNGNLNNVNIIHTPEAKAELETSLRDAYAEAYVPLMALASAWFLAGMGTYSIAILTKSRAEMFRGLTVLLGCFLSIAAWCLYKGGIAAFIHSSSVGLMTVGTLYHVAAYFHTSQERRGFELICRTVQTYLESVSTTEQQS